MDEEIVGLKKIAPKLGVSPRTVRRYIRMGVLEAEWRGGWAASQEAIARCARELARRKIDTGRIG